MFKPKIIKRSDGVAYLKRWHILPRNRFFNIYLHKFVNDDDDRALHDHPWRSLSLILKNRPGLLEITNEQSDAGVSYEAYATPSRISYRPAEFAHRLKLINGAPVWTLFLTGRRVREWGFHCPKGWKPWQKMTTLSGEPLEGCD